MKIQKISHQSLAEAAAGKLAASLLDGSFPPGTQLPAERVLMNQLGVSRATLREALKMLEENRLVESKPNVGWFARAIDESNITQAKELAGNADAGSSARPANGGEPLTGPRRIPTSPEKPIHIPNLQKDRLGTFEFISWWEREKVKNAKVLVIGAGALGNEVLKNLALMGVGNIFIIDFDKIEAANLSRSVLFRETDNNRGKAEVAAARARSINPDVHIQYLNADVTTSLGLGIIRRMDAIIGCLDNREARLAVNRFCYWMNKPWVDGAIQELLGLMRVFVPGDGACYECTLTEQALRKVLPTQQDVPVLCLDIPETWSPAENTAAYSTSRSSPEDVAYIMYTSGSSGCPKGVVVPHRGVVRLVNNAQYANFGPDEVFLQAAPVSFDASTFEIWGALLNGARLVLMPEQTPTLESLGEVIRHHKVTTLWLTAGLFHLMVEERLEDLAHVEKLRARFPHCRLINGYGPTENTTFSCCFTVPPDYPLQGSVPIGRPIAHTQAYILDAHRQPVVEPEECQRARALPE